MDEPTRPCIRCGYDISGLSPADRCPECGGPALDAGEAFDPRGLEARRIRLHRAATILAAIVLLAILVALCSR